jgi:hypothetical protein
MDFRDEEIDRSIDRSIMRIKASIMVDERFMEPSNEGHTANQKQSKPFVKDVYRENVKESSGIRTSRTM